MAANKASPPLSAPIRVLIADDHAVVREGIRHVLSAAEGFDVVGEAANGREAVALAEELHPDVVVLDLTMPEISGLDAAVQIRARTPGSRILVLSIHDHE
jgi:DNA-binding NarL/FixJ family response regulator